MMTVSFPAFRDRYPDAKITSELLLVQSDRFVVKVTVETTSTGCATGIAAHNSVETAEDRARVRALEALGWPLDEFANSTNDAPPSISTAPSWPVASDPTDLRADKATAQPPLESALPDASIENSEPEPPNISAVSQTVDQATAAPPRSSKPVKATTEKTKVEKTKVEKTHEPTAAPATELTDPAAIAPAPKSQPAAATAPIPTGALPAPINLSDVIAQTDIELRRLGWSVEAGREYLEKTYEKRSRHELSEEELIQFLCHLESL